MGHLFVDVIHSTSIDHIRIPVIINLSQARDKTFLP